MSKIIYYVATSLDGFIAGPGDDISAFPSGGKGVEKYMDDLKDFKTVIMGRRTYEFGYQYGLQPGQPAYPHMEHHIFSKTLNFDSRAANVHIEKSSVKRIIEIREASKTDVYLCGGGAFAGWLLEHDLIDQLKIKLNPITLGNGIKLFGKATKTVSWKLTACENFENGYRILTYDRQS